MLFLGLVIFCVVLLTSANHHRFQVGKRAREELECQCVPVHLCEDDGEGNEGEGLLEPRIISNKLCINPNDVCCQKFVVKEDRNVEEATKPSIIPSIQNLHCGSSNLANFQFKIISSTSTEFGELPWNLIIQESGDDKNTYRCGASLIHPRVAVTAAHCIDFFLENPERIVIRAGEWDTNSRSEPLPFQDRYVEEILVHPHYHRLSLKNDIALVFLSEPFILGQNVGLICLAADGKKILETNCIASGWGKGAYKVGAYASVMKKVHVPLIPRDVCLHSLRSTRLGRLFTLHKSFICAGGEKNKDACKGDGGSPLICPVLGQSDRYVQMGIVSWGIGCGTDGIPGVYVNVPIYLDWIDSELNGRDLDTNSYRL